MHTNAGDVLNTTSATAVYLVYEKHIKSEADLKKYKTQLAASEIGRSEHDTDKNIARQIEDILTSQEGYLIERLFFDGKKRRSEMLRFKDDRPLKQIAEHLKNDPSCIQGTFQVDVFDGDYHAGLFSEPTITPEGKESFIVDSSVILDETLSSQRRNSYKTGSIDKRELSPIDFRNYGRDLLPKDIFGMQRMKNVSIQSRKENDANGNEVIVITFGDPSETKNYIEQKILPSRGYALASSSLVAGGKTIRHDVFEDYVQTNIGVWIPRYSKFTTLSAASGEEEQYDIKECIALELPVFNTNIPRPLFAVNVSDEEKKAIANNGYVLPGTSPIGGDLPAPSRYLLLRAALMTIGIILILWSIFRFVKKHS